MSFLFRPSLRSGRVLRTAPAVESRAGAEGVSSVIGTLLVLVALTTLLALLQATTVPGMNRDAEAAHADKVVEEFFSLQEKVDEAGASGVARTAKITPGTLYPQVPFLYNPNPGTAGSVDLRQGQRVYVRYAANASSIPVSVSGRCYNVGGTGGCVNIDSATPEEEDLTSISSFTVYIWNVEEGSGRRVRLQTSGAVVLDNRFKRVGDDLEIDWDGSCTPPSDPQTIADYFTTSMVSIDILANCPSLAGYSGTVDLSFSRLGSADPAEGNYSLTGTRAGSGPQNSTPVNATAALLNFSSNYNYWSPPGPLLRYEHGAVVRVVNNVPFMASPPAMVGASHDSASNNTTVSVTLLRLNATNASVGQRLPLSVRLNPGPLSRSTAMAYNLTLEVGTPFPGLWSSYFNATMNASGLPAAGNWSVSTGGDWARLDIDRGSPPRLNLTVSTAAVEAVL